MKTSLDCNDTETKNMKTVCGIYGLKHKTTGKWYVGQSINIHKRWRDHAKNKANVHPKLYTAMARDGYDSFEKVVLEVCTNDKAVLNSRESFWIDHYNSVEDGYNARTRPATVEKKTALMEAADDAVSVEEVLGTMKSTAILLRLTKENKTRIESAASKLKLTATEFITIASLTFANKTFEGKITKTD